MKRVIVGMSGGVDSSVTALLLKQQGYEVIGLFMKNWEENDSEGVCQSVKDYEDVIRVCDKIGIPYYSVNFVKEYRDHVFASFLEDLKAGHTPNPDILCNREIKFNVFLKKAMELGGDYLATGHYCRNDNGRLLKGVDAGKDQSYFLYTISSEKLQKVLFPIGDLPKSKVREIARDAGLPTSEKKDSTGICFIGKRDFKPFISRYIGYKKGPMVSAEGKRVGSHDGIAFYTIGQRKGLGIGGEGDAWFVYDKDASKNIVYVAQGENHPVLFKDRLQATELTWVDEQVPEFPFRCTAKIRYRQDDQPCTLVKMNDGVMDVIFDAPQRAITPRQSIVFYQGECCLGGGIISPFNT